MRMILLKKQERGVSLMTDVSRRNYWEPLVYQWQASGLNAKAWCRQQNISYHSFWGWRNKILNLSPKHLIPKSLPIKPITIESFVELSSTKSQESGIELFCNDISIRVSRNFDESVLAACLRLARRA